MTTNQVIVDLSGWNSVANSQLTCDGFIYRIANGMLTDQQTSSCNSEGVDAKLWYHLAQDSEKPFGLYHFVNDGWGTEQFDHAQQIIEQVRSKYRKETLGIWLDFEDTSPIDEATIKSYVEYMANLYPDVGIYTGEWWWNQYITDGSWCSQYPLWAAAYIGGDYLPDPSSKYVTPKGWPPQTAKVWQFTSEGQTIVNSPVSVDCSYLYS